MSCFSELQVWTAYFEGIVHGILLAIGIQVVIVALLVTLLRASGSRSNSL